MRPSRVVAPVALLIALGLILVRWHSRPVPPVAVGRPFPHLALGTLPKMPPLTDATLRAGQPVLVNLFASWCVPCRAEAPVLATLGGKGITVVGIAVRDTPAAASAFLTTSGARFAAVGLDPHERLQPALASSGIPETWLVDGGGIVRARFRGDLHADDITTVAAAVDAAR